MKIIDLFLPLYNEEKIISEHLKILNDEITSKNFKKYHINICVVNDASTDKSKEILKETSKKISIKIYDFNKGPSRRENLSKAMKTSKADYVGYIDFDLATDIKHLSELIYWVAEKNFDISIGSRYLKKSKVKREWYRILLSKPYNWFNKIYLGSKLKDHQCGFKLFKTKVFKNLAEKSGYDHKYQRGWFWDVEMMVRAQKLGYTIKEFPVKWKAGEQSSFNLKRELKLVPYMIKLRWKL